MRKRRPSKSSLKWFQEEWLKSLSKIANSSLVIEASNSLGQLSYQNKILQQRINDLEKAIDYIVSLIKTNMNDIDNLNQTVSHTTAFLHLNLKKKDGMFFVSGIPHLHECAKVQQRFQRNYVGKPVPCTCGSEPDASSTPQELKEGKSN